MTCKKIPLLYGATRLAGGVLIKMLNYFEVMLKKFYYDKNLPRVTDKGSRLVYVNKFSSILQSYFLSETSSW